MADLKHHRDAMVALLASSTAIPASSSRLAHAMHDVLSLILDQRAAPTIDTDIIDTDLRPQATTSGLNDAALAQAVKAMQVDQPRTKPYALSPAEVRVKELENTIRQLKLQAKKDKGALREKTAELEDVRRERDAADAQADALYLQVQNLGQCLDAWRGIDNRLREIDEHPIDDNYVIKLMAGVMTSWRVGIRPTAEAQRAGCGAITAAGVTKEDV